MITPPTIPDNHFSSSDGQGLLPDESNSQQLENSGSRAVNISDMMRLFQSSMEKEFQKVSSKLDGVIERIDSLEKSQTTLEEQMQSYQSMHANTSGSTPKTPSSRKRKRLTPVDLQVIIIFY